jgi:hypothetical protein
VVDREGLLLPEGTRLLHIGPQKTGSTAIQAALHELRDQLLEHGVVYPGPTMRPAEAARAGLGFSTPRGAPRPRREAWDDLLRQLQEAEGRRVCISHEAFGRATDLQAERVVAELGGSRPHVVAVARRYDRLLPSQWQQRVKAGEHLSYEEWLRIVLDDSRSADPVWRNLWVPHDTQKLVRRWAGLVGPENFTLVVSDDTDRELLPRSFERLLGLPEGLITVRPSKTNRSLTFHEVELLRRLNILFEQQGWRDKDYYFLVYRGVVRRMVRSAAPEGAAVIPPLPSWAAERVAELSQIRFDALKESGVRVVGELEALRCEPVGVPGEDPVAVTHISIETALKGMEGMVIGARHMRWELRDQHRRRQTKAVKRARRKATRSATAKARRALPPPRRSLTSRIASRSASALRRLRRRRRPD